VNRDRRDLAALGAVERGRLVPQSPFGELEPQLGENARRP